MVAACADIVSDHHTFKTNLVLVLRTESRQNTWVTKPRHSKVLTTREVAKLSGIPITTINTWVSRKLCRPSVMGSAGSRVERYWHPRDVVVLKTIRTLRKAGCSMTLLRRVDKLVRDQWDNGQSDASLIFDGHDILFVDTEKRLISAGKEPGQALFEMPELTMRAPIGSWIETVRPLGNEVDLVAERTRRGNIKRRRDELSEIAATQGHRVSG